MLFLTYLHSFSVSYRYQLLPWKYLWWNLFLQLLNVTHRCYHTTFTSSNGFEHFSPSKSPNSKFFSNGRWNKAPGTFSTSHWFPSTCVRSRFAVLIYSKVTDFQLQPVSYYHCWAGERQSIQFILSHIKDRGFR